MVSFWWSDLNGTWSENSIGYFRDFYGTITREGAADKKKGFIVWASRSKLSAISKSFDKFFFSSLLVKTLPKGDWNNLKKFLDRNYFHSVFLSPRPASHRFSSYSLVIYGRFEKRGEKVERQKKTLRFYNAEERAA